MDGVVYKWRRILRCTDIRGVDGHEWKAFYPGMWSLCIAWVDGVLLNSDWGLAPILSIYSYPTIVLKNMGFLKSCRCLKIPFFVYIICEWPHESIIARLTLKYFKKFMTQNKICMNIYEKSYFFIFLLTNCVFRELFFSSLAYLLRFSYNLWAHKEEL